MSSHIIKEIYGNMVVTGIMATLSYYSSVIKIYASVHGISLQFYVIIIQCTSMSISPASSSLSLPLSFSQCSFLLSFYSNVAHRKSDNHPSLHRPHLQNKKAATVVNQTVKRFVSEKLLWKEKGFNLSKEMLIHTK